MTDSVLAGQLLALFDSMIAPENAWSLGWDPARKRLQWRDAGGELDRGPDAGMSRRAVARLACWLPVDPLL